MTGAIRWGTTATTTYLDNFAKEGLSEIPVLLMRSLAI